MGTLPWTATLPGEAVIENPQPKPLQQHGASHGVSGGKLGQKIFPAAFPAAQFPPAWTSETSKHAKVGINCIWWSSQEAAVLQ